MNATIKRFTIIEAAISMVIFSLILAVAMSGIISAQNNLEKSISFGEAEQMGMNIGQKLREHFKNCRLTDATINGIHNDSLYVLEYQLPVINPSTQSYIDETDPDNIELYWGAYEDGVGVVGNTYSGVPDSSTVERIEERTVEKDINKDGDTDDIFQLYRIQITTTYGNTFNLCPKVCISEVHNESGSPLYDLGERVFRLEKDDREFHIVLWICEKSSSGEFYLYRLHEVFTLENTF